MTFCFLGNSHFSFIVLQNLLNNNFVPNLIITTSPKPIGRKQTLTPNEVDALSKKHNIKVIYGDHLNDNTFLNTLKQEKIDVGILAAFGKIIPVTMIKLFPYGIINIHPSLLPKYRGPSPIQTALLNGDTETGVTLFIISEGIDDGPIIGEVHQAIDPNDTFQTLSEKLANIGSKLTINIIPKYTNGNISVRPQQESEATFTKKFTHEDGKINWNNPSQTIYNQIRALSHEPGTYCFFNKNEKQQILKIHQVNLVVLNEPINISSVTPGTVIFHNNHLLVSSANGLIDLLLVQPEGKNIISGSSFWNGNKISLLY